MSRRMLLKNKLTSTCMSKIDTVASYLMKITELRDQLATVGDKVEENELVWISLNGFGPSWHHFVHSVYVLVRSYLHLKACGMPLLGRR
jgi:hypothetical protein